MRIKVKVIPSASREEILQCNDGLKIYVNQPAQDGRANKELIEILADYFHTKKYNITIIQGIKTRNKVVEIRDT